MREPVDGPVLAVVAVDSVEEAIALANDSEYCLGASVWTRDRYRGLRIARELHAGMVWLNDHLPGPAVSRGPWGAAAGGGLGRVLGEAGLRACAQEKLIVWSQPGMRGLWWGPYDQVLEGGARAVAQLRSGRDSDRERAWRHGAVGAGPWWGTSAGGAGCRGRTATLLGCPPRPMQARSASVSCAEESAISRASRGCSTPRSTSPA